VLGFLASVVLTGVSIFYLIYKYREYKNVIEPKKCINDEE